MGKRLIIKGADFSAVAVSKEVILNPLLINGIGQGGIWMDEYYPVPVGEYIFLINNGNLYVGASGGEQVAEMPEGYDSLNYEGAWLYKEEGSTRYDVAYPDLFEKITWGSNDMGYRYNASQNTEPQLETISGFKAARVHLNPGDVLLWSGSAGISPRAIWVMKTDYSETIKVTSESTTATYGPAGYKATVACEVFMNNANGNTMTSYILRA